MTTCSSVSLVVVLFKMLFYAEMCDGTKNGIFFRDALKGTSFGMFVHEIVLLCSSMKFVSSVSIGLLGWSHTGKTKENQWCLIKSIALRFREPWSGSKPIV